MPNKPSHSISQQIQLLKDRGMLFRNEQEVSHFLANISYYRLKGYWWDMQSDSINHIFKPDSYFEDVLDRYTFDRKLRLILFDAIERIEVALKTKMIYHLSQKYGGLWYLRFDLTENANFQLDNLTLLNSEFKRSKELFIEDHKKRFPNDNPDAWKILEVASMGTLSKIYKNIKNQLPEKAIIAKEMGFNMHNELSSFLASIAYIRNIIAHHSRLWNRNMARKPIMLTKPTSLWLQPNLLPAQYQKPFYAISSMIYICNKVSPNHQIKQKILQLINSNPSIPVYKMGFLNNWEKDPFWV